MSQGTNVNRPLTRWALEVIRGQNVGQVIPVAAGEVVVGASTKSSQGINLASQEGQSPRKMEPRHASLTCSNQSLSIRDLESPGGTFVNRKRLLSQQTFPLSPGDIIQLGSVQLAVVDTAPPKPAAPAAAPVPKPADNRSVRTPAPPTPPATSSTAKIASTPNADRRQTGSAAHAAPVKLAPPSSPEMPSKPTPPTPPVAHHQQPERLNASRLPVPFQIKAGATCRTWDDFLTQAAQRWTALRDELASGRLSEYLRTIDRPDLLPRPVTGRELDDQLDDWLARLPTSHSSEPELDVHPEALEIRQASSGGTVMRSIRVTNIGYRLLRGTARVEPVATPWLRLGPHHDGRPFAAIDDTDIVVEIDLPEVWAQPLSASVVIETNGGHRRIPVKLEQASRIVEPQAGFEVDGLASSSATLFPSELLLHRPPASRAALGAVLAVALRSLALSSRFIPVTIAAPPSEEPKLLPIAIIFCLIGWLIAGIVALLHRRPAELRSTAFSAGVLGLISAAILFALIRTLEPMFGAFASSVVGKLAIWSVLGAIAGLLSTTLIPYKPRDREAS